jgi:hypothetical protein
MYICNNQEKFQKYFVNKYLEKDFTNKTTMKLKSSINVHYNTLTSWISRIQNGSSFAIERLNVLYNNCIRIFYCMYYNRQSNRQCFCNFHTISEAQIEINIYCIRIEITVLYLNFLSYYFN